MLKTDSIYKRIYDADKGMFLYPKQLGVKTENRFDPLARVDVKKEEDTSQEEQSYNSNQVSSSRFNPIKYYTNYDDQIIKNVVKNNNKKIDCSGYPMSFNEPLINDKNRVFNSVLDYLLYTHNKNPGSSTIETLDYIYLNTVYKKYPLSLNKTHTKFTATNATYATNLAATKACVATPVATDTITYVDHGNNIQNLTQNLSIEPLLSTEQDNLINNKSVNESSIFFIPVQGTIISMI